MSTTPANLKEVRSITKTYSPCNTVVDYLLAYDDTLISYHRPEDVVWVEYPNEEHLVPVTIHQYHKDPDTAGTAYIDEDKIHKYIEVDQYIKNRLQTNDPVPFEIVTTLQTHPLQVVVKLSTGDIRTLPGRTPIAIKQQLPTVQGKHITSWTGCSILRLVLDPNKYKNTKTYLV